VLGRLSNRSIAERLFKGLKALLSIGQAGDGK
jgi:hypothetical protein